MAKRTPPSRRAPTAASARKVEPPATSTAPPPVARARGGAHVAKPVDPRLLAGEDAPKRLTRIKVRAVGQGCVGYYDHVRRYAGDVFFIADETAFSPKWMERVGSHVPERVTSSPEALKRQHDEILRDKMPARGTPLVHDEPHADDDPLGARP